MNYTICNNCKAENSENSKYCKECGYALFSSSISPAPLEKNTLKNNKKLKNKLIITIVTIASFSLSYWGIQKLLFSVPKLDKMLVQIANESNSNCPFMVDGETRLDNTIALPDNTFQYNYTLINFTKDEIDINTLKDFIEPNIINGIKTNPDMEFFRKNKVTMVYYYKDKNGEFVYKFSATPEMYK